MEMSLIAPKFRASIFSSHLHVYIMYIYIYIYMFTSSKVDEVGIIFSEDSLALTAWQPAPLGISQLQVSARLRPSGFSAFFGFATCRACRATAGFGGKPRKASRASQPELYVWLYGYV